ncbi:MAG: hypothetical protein ACRER2_00330 [Methylococcales bacterium]
MTLAPHITAAIIGVIGVALTFLANRRLIRKDRQRETNALITAIRSDISSIVYAVDQSRLVASYISTLRSPPDAPVYASPVDLPRNENYFQLFDALAPQLGRMPPELAKQVVRFYTFFRVARDAAVPLETQEQSPVKDVRHVEQARNVLFALSQSFQAAEIVLREASATDDLRDGAATAENLVAAIAEAIDQTRVD